MSMLLLAGVMIAAVNPFRVRLGIGEDRPSPIAVSVGAGIALAIVAAVAASSDGVLGALEISPETYLIAAGVVAVLAGGRGIFFPTPVPEPSLPGWRAGLWPIAYPHLLAPEVLAITLAVPGQRGVGATIVAGAVAIGLAALAGLVRLGSWRIRVAAAAGRLLATSLVVAGIWMVIEGIRDV